MSSIIESFRGPYAFLSNFAPSPVMFEGMQFPTVENAFQAAKTANTSERFMFQQLAPNYAKKAGRQVHLRPDWEQCKNDVMYQLLLSKFEPGTELCKKLLATGEDYLCEGNTWHDNYWGACNCPRCVHSEHKNWLGYLLMRVRAERAV